MSTKLAKNVQTILTALMKGKQIQHKVHNRWITYTLGDSFTPLTPTEMLVEWRVVEDPIQLAYHDWLATTTLDQLKDNFSTFASAYKAGVLSVTSKQE